VREGNVPVDKAPGVTIASMSDGMVVLDMGSGSYRFTARSR
jgi:hypothetical protein